MLRFFLRFVFAAAFSLGVLGSCMGISSVISLRRDGSGTISLEYRLSSEMESLGKLDGNAMWPAVPIGRADFERTAARVPGLAVKSFRTFIEKNDVVSRVTLSFAGVDALVRFLDASGGRAFLSTENGVLCLSLLLAAEGGGVESGLRELIDEASRGYFLSMSFSLPSEAEAILVGEKNTPVDLPKGWELTGGSRVSFSAPIGEALLFDGPLYLEIRWKP
ncbi:MAG: hypothetical protein LBU18_02105 [Treponema sp.]|jgi:hypothetical protein|nr:hypothetical protein [Treponema sp.]